MFEGEVDENYWSGQRKGKWGCKAASNVATCIVYTDCYHYYYGMLDVSKFSHRSQLSVEIILTKLKAFEIKPNVIDISLMTFLNYLG